MSKRAKGYDHQQKQELYKSIFAFTPSISESRMIQIIEAAIECFATLGVEESTYAVIAKKARISRPLVHHYFPDFEDLWVLVIKYIRTHYQELVIAEIKSEKSAKDQLRAYIRSALDWTITHPKHFSIWMLFFYRTTYSKTDLELNSELTSLGHERIEGLIRIGIEEKSFKCSNPKLIAKKIQILITGAIITLGTEKPFISLEEMKQEITKETFKLL